MNEISSSDLARALAARRRQAVKRCAVCETPITGIAIRRYCSNACSIRASRNRAKARAHAGQTPENTSEPC